MARRHLRVEGIGVGDEMRRRMANAKLAAKLPEAPFVVEAIEQLQVRQRKARRMQQMPTSDQRPCAGSVAGQRHRDSEVAGQTIDLVGEIVVVGPADDPVAWDVLVAVAGQGEGLGAQIAQDVHLGTASLGTAQNAVGEPVGRRQDEQLQGRGCPALRPRTGPPDVVQAARSPLDLILLWDTPAPATIRPSLNDRRGVWSGFRLAVARLCP